jgi:pimeloyl-ACP methyl ester carboxylesterase
VWIEKRRVRTSSGELAIVDTGDPEAPAVVLIHGFGTSSFLWRRLIPMFSPWMRVIAPDLLGAGDSDKPRDVDLRISAHRDLLREALRELGVDRCAVIGHAHGGGVAQLLAVEGGVDALCLVDSIAFDAWPSPAVRDLQRSVDRAGPVVPDVWIRTMFDLGMAHRDRLHEPDLEEFLRVYRGEPAVAAFVHAARAVDGSGLEAIESRLSELDIPALILWGEEDAFLGVGVAERLGEVLPRAAVAVLPGCGHFLLEDAPDTVAPLIFQWLRSQYLKHEHRHEPGGPVVVSLGRRPEGEGG